MDGNGKRCGEFGERCIRLSEVRELAAGLICADFATWRLLPAPHFQVCVPKMDVLVVYCPSLILLYAISIPTIAGYSESLKPLTATTLCSCNRLCFHKQFHCGNSVSHWPALHLNQLQTSLYMMTVSVVAALSGQAGFRISKTFRYLWPTL
jgi:hypothetical protein